MEIFQFINISEYFIDILYITEKLLLFVITFTILFLIIYAKLQRLSIGKAMGLSTHQVIIRIHWSNISSHFFVYHQEKNHDLYNWQYNKRARNCSFLIPTPFNSAKILPPSKLDSSKSFGHFICV